MGYRLSQEQASLVVTRGAKALCNYCMVNEKNYIVTGSSGGLDSAVTLGIAQKACEFAEKRNHPLTSVGLIMPCNSNPRAEVLGREAIHTFGAKEISINLDMIFELVMKLVVHDVDRQVKSILRETRGRNALEYWGWSEKVAQGNIKARLRMMLGTYHVARMMNGIVLSTDNLSEWWMAFWTICGDVGDFGIIQKVLKGSELYDIASYLDVPQEIIKAKPDDGLGVAGGDEDQLGASYQVLDRVIIKLIKNGFDIDGSLNQIEHLPKVEGVDADTVIDLAVRCLRGSYKRKGTINLSREELGLPPITEIKFD